MNLIKFVKMNGIGNDYIFMEWQPNLANVELEKLAKNLSDRHYGVGGDGLVIISLVGDIYKMTIYNSDGSLAKMCGNAIRCVAKYLYERGKISANANILTDSGKKKVEIAVNDGLVTNVTIGMGTAKRMFLDIENIFGLVTVNIGNNHAVKIVENIDQQFFLAPQIATSIEDGINVEFVEVLDRYNLAIRVWERGSNETLACGTGATAAAFATNILGLTEKRVTCHLIGGKLEINLDKDNIYMTGGATLNYEGIIDVKEYANGKN